MKRKQRHELTEKQRRDIYALKCQIAEWKKDIANANLLLKKMARLIKHIETLYRLDHAWIGIIENVILRIAEAVWFLDRAEFAMAGTSLIEGSMRSGYKSRFPVFVDLLAARHKLLAHYFENAENRNSLWKDLCSKHGNEGTISKLLMKCIEAMENVIENLEVSGV